MNGFGLLVGHLLGDYILQNDWMAANKTNPHPGRFPGSERLPDGSPCIGANLIQQVTRWDQCKRLWIDGHLACTVHCFLYTLAVWLCSFWWMPWWGLAICFAAHWPIDRFRLARIWMDRVSGQKAFAEKMAPWSVIVVDNTAHLLTLLLIGKLAGF